MRLFGTARDIAELKRRVEDLETQAKRLDLEWSSTYDKFRTILSRIAKRQQRDADQETASAGYQEPTDNEPSLVPSVGSSLSGRHQTIQQQILARRSRLARPA